MEELKIHESLIPYVVGLTGKQELNPTGFDNVNIIRKINAAYQDCIKFFPRTKLFKFIAYSIVEEAYPLKKLDTKQVNDYLKEILDNKEMRLKLMSGQPQSEFFSVLRDITPYYITFNNAINNNRGYEAVVAYEELTHILDAECLSLYPEKYQDEECKKRFNFPLNDKKTYDYRMKTKRYPKKKEFEIETLTTRGFYSKTCFLLSKLFHEMMVEFYKQKGFIYAPVNDDLSFYQFASFGVLEYKYADDLSFTIRGYSWTQYEFWALLNGEDKYTPTVNSNTIRKKIPYNGRLLVVPEGYKEEAIITYFMKELGETKITPEFLDLIKKMGIPEEFAMSNSLSTYDYRTFYIDPRKYEDIQLRHPECFPTLQKIKNKPDDERDQYFKKIYATYKGQHPSKIEEEETYRERLKRNPKAWID